MKPRVMILLAGCGKLDGTDPFESVLCHYWLEKLGCEVIYGAASGDQLHAVDHLSGEEIPDAERSMMQESARLVRGKLFPLNELSPKLMDGIVIPGGQGVLKNLLVEFGSADSHPQEEVSDFLTKHHDNQGVIVGLSLAASLLSTVFKGQDFDFDLLQLKPGNYLVNKELRFIVAPASLLASSVLALNIEIENVMGEFKTLLDLKD